jgi:apolipoprotein N-acyltransferase
MDALPTRMTTWPLWRLALLALIMGALSVLAMAPFFLWPIMFLTFPLFIWILDAICVREPEGEETLTAFWKRVKRAAITGWAFGTGYFFASIYWIGYAFYVDAERYALLMPFSVTALAAALGLFYALPAAAVAVMWQRGYARIAAFAFAFFCAEAARGYLFTGFPWNLFGQALAANAEHMQLAAYIGVYGLTLLALFVFSAPAACVAASKARYGRLYTPVILACAVLSGSYVLGMQRLSRTAGLVEDARIRIVQPNIPQQEKWKPENRRWIFDRMLALSRGGTSGEDISHFSHVIWPESSVPFLFGFNRGIFSAEAQALLATLLSQGTTLILGAERAEGILSVDGRYNFDRAFNSLFVLGPGASVQTIYDKTHLVPFGEYVPFREALTAVGFRVFSHRMDGFEAGLAEPQPIETPRAPAFLPLICYEIIFPGRVADQRRRPGWFVNVTNDAWFGNSTGPYQHLHQARIRAVEEGIPVIRAANTGISAVIDPFGRVLSQLGLGETGVIDHALPSAISATFYEKNRYSVFIILSLLPLQLYLTFLALAGKQ